MPPVVQQHRPVPATALSRLRSRALRSTSHAVGQARGHRTARHQRPDQGLLAPGQVGHVTRSCPAASAIASSSPRNSSAGG